MDGSVLRQYPGTHARSAAVKAKRRSYIRLRRCRPSCLCPCVVGCIGVLLLRFPCLWTVTVVPYRHGLASFMVIGWAYYGAASEPLASLCFFSVAMNAAVRDI